MQGDHQLPPQGVGILPHILITPLVWENHLTLDMGVGTLGMVAAHRRQMMIRAGAADTPF